MSETSDHQLKKDDMCSDFARAAIVAAKPMPNDQLQGSHPSVASPALAKNALNEASLIEHRPVRKERMLSIRCEEPQPETSDVDKEKAEYEAISRMDRASLIEYYEKKLGDFIAVPQNLQEISSKTYSRSLIQIMRDVISNIHTIPCPLSEDALKQIGIDRMPSPASVSHDKSKYNTRGDSFNIPWRNDTSSNVKKLPYNARQNCKKYKEILIPLLNKVKEHRERKANLPSILIRSVNAWVPNTLMNKTDVPVDASSVEVRIEKVRKDVFGLLNKMTPSNSVKLSMEIINKAVWKDPETLPTVVELIFIKAVEEPTFVKIYYDLCSSIHQAEQDMEKENFHRHFHVALIRELQKTFENTSLSRYQESAGMLEKQIEEEQGKEEMDDKKVADLKKQLDEMKAHEKRRMIGIIKFTFHLFRIGLLNFKIIENCIVILLRNAVQSKSELMVEYVVELMKHVGPYTAHKKDEEFKVELYVTYLERFKPTVSNRVKFMIMDLMEMRDKKWVRIGPKTLDEVNMDYLKLEEQKRRDREKTAADQEKENDNVVDEYQRSLIRSSFYIHDKFITNPANAMPRPITVRRKISKLQHPRLCALKNAWNGIA